MSSNADLVARLRYWSPNRGRRPESMPRRTVTVRESIEAMDKATLRWAIDNGYVRIADKGSCDGAA